MTTAHMIYYIYALSDPRDNCIRYVGSTNNVKRRYYEHCGKQYGSNHRTHWLTLLRSLHIKPRITILEECNETTWEEKEIYWISLYRKQEYCLVNETDGGEGCHNPSIEVRQKRRLAHLGKPKTEEHKRKVSLGLMGLHPTEETRRKMSTNRMGNTYSRGKNSKLSRSDVLEIRRLLDQGESQASLSVKYNVRPNTISNIHTGKNWRWLTDEA